ncbi:MAG TPA: hypothetical protein VF407_25275 [Polyangiaceae bacterium]
MPAPPTFSRARIVAEAVGLAIAAAILDVAWCVDRGWFELHVSEPFCTQREPQLHRLLAVRLVLVAVATFVALWLRPRVGRWAVRIGGKEAFLATLRMTVAAVLALVFVDLGLRAKNHIHPPPPFPPAPLPPTQPAPHVWWASKTPSTTVMQVEGHDVTYTIDGDGFRSKTEQSTTDWNAPSILFAGESITEGIGVDVDEAYPAIVARDLGVQSVPAAVHGYANDQVYLLGKWTLARLAHPVAVVTIVVPHLLSRDVSPARERLVVGGDGSLQPREQAPSWWLDSPVRRIGLSLVPYHDDSAVGLARTIFVATAKEAEARGAYPLFVFTQWGDPCLPGDDSTPPIQGRLFDGVPVHWIDVELDPATFDRTTFHPRADGQRKLADAIEKALRAGGIRPTE